MREKTGGSLMSTGLDSGEARERQGHGRAGLYPGGGALQKVGCGRAGDWATRMNASGR